MAAPKNNKNSVGNSGGKSLQDRELAARVRSLALGEIEKILKRKKGKLYEAVIIKLAGTVLPRLNEHTGADGGELFPAPIYGGISISLRRHDGDEKNLLAQEANPSG